MVGKTGQAVMAVPLQAEWLFHHFLCFSKAWPVSKLRIQFLTRNYSFGDEPTSGFEAVSKKEGCNWKVAVIFFVSCSENQQVWDPIFCYVFWHVTPTKHLALSVVLEVSNWYRHVTQSSPFHQAFLEGVQGKKKPTIANDFKITPNICKPVLPWNLRAYLFSLVKDGFSL